MTENGWMNERINEQNTSDSKYRKLTMIDNAALRQEMRKTQGSQMEGVAALFWSHWDYMKQHGGKVCNRR